MLTMEILRVASFILLFCCYSVICFPSRPLNERSTELAWQAWLLVDDQNQHRQQSLTDNFPRRRITPKSVFIAPTFSPESLPACADGYRPDSMGRCIKIIKLDEEAHLEFLLEKLNAQFGNYDEMEEESQENAAASGPFQLNIPLNNNPQEGPTKELDIAIVVAPTNGNFLQNEKTTSATTNALGNSKIGKIPMYTEEILGLAEQTNNSTGNTEAISTTTKKYPEVTTNLNSVLETTLSTTQEQSGTSTSASIPTLESTTTSSITEETTITDQHALFFLQSSLYNSEHVQNNGTRNVNDTPLVTSDHDNNKAPSNNSLTTSLSNSEFVIDASINLNNRLPSLSTNIDFTEAPSAFNENADTTSSANLVRFPSSDSVTPVSYVKFPDQITEIRILPHLRPNFSSEQKTSTTPFDNLKKQPLYQTVFKGYLNPDGTNNLKGNEHFIFKDVTKLPNNLVSDPVNGNHNMHANYNQVFNHRNRDKNSNLWSVPPSWSQSSPKPIILRFSRRAVSGRHLLSEQLRSQTQNSQTFYREVPSEEFSYLFGRDKNNRYKQNPR